MSLLHEIQAAVLQDDLDLGPILLKVQFLAARLGSQPLAEWVKHESEGYPEDADPPDYRTIPVMYKASFSGPFGSGIRNAQVPPHLIEQFAGKSWVQYKMRESIASVDELLASSAEGETLGIDVANLILLLQGKVYPDYVCNEVRGTISRTSLANIRHLVRSRILELTIELEKSVPEASAVVLGKAEPTSSTTSAAATQIVHQTIYGNATSVFASGDGAQTNVVIGERDMEGFVQFLVQSGLPETDARQLGEIVATEEPESKTEPMGPKARRWLADNLRKVVDGTWKIGIAVGAKAIEQAFLKYYGLK